MEIGFLEPVFEKPNSNHQYLQNLVKRIAEKKGFRASLEKQVFDGIGKIDVTLENDSQKIACEIAVTNTANYELQNIRKCLASGYRPVIVISTDEKHLTEIKQKAEENLPPTDLANVAFLKPEAFADFLESLIETGGTAANKTKGFTVSARYNEQIEAGQITRIKSIRETLLNVFKRREQEKDEQPI